MYTYPVFSPKAFFNYLHIFFCLSFLNTLVNTFVIHILFKKIWILRTLTIGSLKHKNRKVRGQVFVHIQLKFAEKGRCFYFVVLFINTPLSSMRMLCGADSARGPYKQQWVVTGSGVQCAALREIMWVEKHYNKGRSQDMYVEYRSKLYATLLLLHFFLLLKLFHSFYCSGRGIDSVISSFTYQEIVQNTTYKTFLYKGFCSTII